MSTPHDTPTRPKVITPAMADEVLASGMRRLSSRVREVLQAQCEDSAPVVPFPEEELEALAHGHDVFVDELRGNISSTFDTSYADSIERRAAMIRNAVATHAAVSTALLETRTNYRALRGWFTTYAEHAMTCVVPCNCGLDAVLRLLEEQD